MLFYAREMLGGISMIVTIPTTATGAGTTSAISTPSIATTVTGGTAPFTYLWTVSNQTGSKTVIVNTPTAASTAFSIGGTVPGDSGTCNAKCTVTATGGATAVSNICAVQLDRA